MAARQSTSVRDTSAGGSTKTSDFWSTTGVREVLHRELYRGQIVYGKTRWQDKGGTRIKVDVPEAKWLRLEAPELRPAIVPALALLRFAREPIRDHRSNDEARQAKQ